LKILFIDLTTSLESFQDLENKGRGGMVSSLYILPNVLSQLGHECYVMSDAKSCGETINGVRWINESQYDWLDKQSFDFMVLNRQLYGDAFSWIKSKHRVLWVHDMVHGGWITKPEIAKMLSATVFMSQYSVETWKAYYKTIGRHFVIPNGVDKELFKPLNKTTTSMIYFSAPNRGLEYLPMIFHSVKEKIPDVSCIAFSNMKSLHPNESGESDKFEWIYQLVRDSGIVLHDVIDQKSLSTFIGASGLMIKPSDYAETCSNSTLQSLSCGTPVITSKVGADKEWVQDKYNGRICDHILNDGPLFILEMCRAIIDTLSNDREHERMIKNAPKTKNLFTWQEIGEKWNRMLNRVY
jgi:glycosyltransferase involved in cell wall biosynthesis